MKVSLFKLGFSLAVAFTVFSCFYYDKETNDSSGNEENNPNTGNEENNPNSNGENNPIVSGGTFTDSRDGRVYRYVTINDQTWMAENLNYAANGSKCGNGDYLTDANTTSCNTYGRLYIWEMANTVCPSGWRLPSDDDWDVLMKSVNPNCSPKSEQCPSAGKLLKASNGWNNSGNGTDAYGFSALPGGYSQGTYFKDVGYRGYWYSSSYCSSLVCYRTIFHDYDSVFRSPSGKDVWFSVRCIKGQGQE